MRRGLDGQPCGGNRTLASFFLDKARVFLRLSLLGGEAVTYTSNGVPCPPTSPLPAWAVRCMCQKSRKQPGRARCEQADSSPGTCSSDGFRHQQREGRCWSSGSKVGGGSSGQRDVPGTSRHQEMGKAGKAALPHSPAGSTLEVGTAVCSSPIPSVTSRKLWHWVRRLWRPVTWEAGSCPPPSVCSAWWRLLFYNFPCLRCHRKQI